MSSDIPDPAKLKETKDRILGTFRSEIKGYEAFANLKEFLNSKTRYSGAYEGTMFTNPTQEEATNANWYMKVAINKVLFDEVYISGIKKSQLSPVKRPHISFSFCKNPFVTAADMCAPGYIKEICEKQNYTFVGGRFGPLSEVKEKTEDGKTKLILSYCIRPHFMAVQSKKGLTFVEELLEKDGMKASDF